MHDSQKNKKYITVPSALFVINLEIGKLYWKGLIKFLIKFNFVFERSDAYHKFKQS